MSKQARGLKRCAETQSNNTQWYDERLAPVMPLIGKLIEDPATIGLYALTLPGLYPQVSTVEIWSSLRIAASGAALSGNLPLLKDLVSRGFGDTLTTLANYAANGGHVHVLQYLVDTAPPGTVFDGVLQRIPAIAKRRNDLELTLWFIEQDVVYHGYDLMPLGQSTQAKTILQRLHALSLQPGSTHPPLEFAHLRSSAIAHDNIEVFQWLLDVECDDVARALRAAMNWCTSIQTCIWLMERKAEFTELTLRSFVRAYNAEAVAWAFENNLAVKTTAQIFIDAYDDEYPNSYRPHTLERHAATYEVLKVLIKYKVFDFGSACHELAQQNAPFEHFVGLHVMFHQPAINSSLLSSIIRYGCEYKADSERYAKCVWAVSQWRDDRSIDADTFYMAYQVDDRLLPLMCEKGISTPSTIAQNMVAARFSMPTLQWLMEHNCPLVFDISKHWPMTHSPAVLNVIYAKSNLPKGEFEPDITPDLLEWCADLESARWLHDQVPDRCRTSLLHAIMHNTLLVYRMATRNAHRMDTCNEWSVKWRQTLAWVVEVSDASLDNDTLAEACSLHAVTYLEMFISLGRSSQVLTAVQKHYTQCSACSTYFTTWFAQYRPGAIGAISTRTRSRLRGASTYQPANQGCFELKVKRCKLMTSPDPAQNDLEVWQDVAG